MNPGSFPRANRTPIHPENTCKADTSPRKNTCKVDTHTYRRQVVIKTGSRSDWSCGNKINRIKTRPRRETPSGRGCAKERFCNPLTGCSIALNRRQAFSSANRRIVIDRQFTAILKPGWHRDETLSNTYLYQIYAYLRSQVDQGDASADRAEGLLLHPSVGENVDEAAVIQGHRIRFMIVDLTAAGSEIRAKLLRVTEDKVEGELSASSFVGNGLPEIIVRSHLQATGWHRPRDQAAILSIQMKSRYPICFGTISTYDVLTSTPSGAQNAGCTRC